MSLAFQICRGRSLGHLDPGPETRESNLTLNRAAGRGRASRGVGRARRSGGPWGGQGAGWLNGLSMQLVYDDAAFLSRAISRTWGENRK